jgi:hypothetical protein
MRHNKLRTIFLLATLFISLSLVAVAKDHDSCANLPMAGEWGFTWTGMLIIGTNPVPAAAVGKSIFDEDGNFSGTLTSSIGGTVSTDTMTGTYTQNPDCTGTLEVTIMGTVSRTATWDTILDDGGKESRAIMKSLVIPGYPPVKPVVTMISRQLFPERGIGK